MPRRQTILRAKEANNTCHIGHHVNASESYHPHFPELTPRRQIIEHRPPPGSFMPRRHIILHRPKTSWECYVYKSPLMLIFALMPQRQTIPFEVLPRFFEVLFEVLFASKTETEGSFQKRTWRTRKDVCCNRQTQSFQRCYKPRRRIILHRSRTSC